MLAPRCERCGFNHWHEHPCLVPRVVPSGTEGVDLWAQWRRAGARSNRRKSVSAAEQRAAKIAAGHPAYKKKERRKK